MRRAYDTLCQIAPYRWHGVGRPPGPGDYLRSTGGSVYLILGSMPIAENPRRLRFQCKRHDPADVPADVTVFPLVWDSRRKKVRTL